MKIITLILSYVAVLLLGAYLESFAQVHLRTVNNRSTYQLALELPRNEYELKKRIVINSVEKQFLDEIQKKKFFPSAEKE